MLLRAAEPIEGVDVMRARRGRESVRELCSGPAKLCQAFGVDRSFDGADLVRGHDLGSRREPRSRRPASSQVHAWASGWGRSTRGGSRWRTIRSCLGVGPGRRYGLGEDTSFDTVISTELVWNAETPADGLCEMTVPAGCVETARTTFT